MLRLFKGRGNSAKVDRSHIKVGIPRFLNIWGTHQFWVSFFEHLGVKVLFSSETSEEQYRDYGKGKITMDSCFPVKCLSGHIGELLTRDINVLFVPMIYSLPSFLKGHVLDTISCTRVMMAPENIKAGFLKERDEFSARGIRYVSPFLTFGEPELIPKQLYESIKDVFDVSYEEINRAVKEGLKSLEDFDRKIRKKSREIIKWCISESRPAVLILARPYHMDSGIGHDIDAEFQAYGYPVLWYNYLPLDEDILSWLFGKDIQAGIIRSFFDISDVWKSSYSSNTNEIIWAAKFGSRFPWITAVIRLSSYECGMDQPTFTPVQRIVESRGTLFFKFGELDETKPTGSIKIRVETITYYLERYSKEIMGRKLQMLPPIPKSLLKSDLY